MAPADAAVQASDRDWTIVRPGRLTNDTGSGRMRIEESPFRGEVPHGDVAAVLAALLRMPASIAHVLYVNRGQDTVADALFAALG